MSVDPRCGGVDSYPSKMSSDGATCVNIQRFIWFVL